MPGRAGGVAPDGRTATHTESTLYLRRSCSGRRMAQIGHIRPAASAPERVLRRSCNWTRLKPGTARRWRYPCLTDAAERDPRFGHFVWVDRRVAARGTRDLC